MVFDAAMSLPVSVNRKAIRLVPGLLVEGQGAEGIREAVTCMWGDVREVSLKDFPLADLFRSG